MAKLFNKKVSQNGSSRTVRYQVMGVTVVKKNRNLKKRRISVCGIPVYVKKRTQKGMEVDKQKEPYTHVAYKMIEGTTGKKVLLFSHEMTLSGAPLALLQVAIILKSNGHYPVVICQNHGPLETELQNNNIAYYSDVNLMDRLANKEENLSSFIQQFDYLLYNTVVSLMYSRYINTKSRSLVWIHEGSAGYNLVRNCLNISHELEKIDEVYSVGAYSKTYTDQYVPHEKSKILLYGVQSKGEPPVRHCEKCTFILLGTCEERKGVHLFVDAVAKLPSEVRANCIFKVIGRIEDNEYCNRVVAEGQKNNVVFTGLLPHKLAIEEMLNADVLVCPSLDDPMPTTCTEAMQLKKVVLCSNRTGTASYIQDGKNGFVYRVGEDDLAEVISRVYNHRLQWEEIGRCAFSVFEENFTMEILERNLKEIFK